MTLELVPGKSIRQSWRTSDFPPEAPDSTILVEFTPKNDGTELTFTHSSIPDGQADAYESGWDESYFQPMREYYSAIK